MPKTTEFMLTVAVIIGILLSALLIKGGDTVAGGGGTDEVIARHAWLYVAIVTARYAIARGLAKSGSREPYFDGGANQDRDAGECGPLFLVTKRPRRRTHVRLLPGCLVTARLLRSA